MRPTIYSGEFLLFTKSHSYSVGDIVLARMNAREVVKRIVEVTDKGYYLVGDNASESSDSRHYGQVAKKDIIASMKIKFPNPTDPPKLVKSHGLWLGRALAVVMIIMVLVHLFRIDTFIPILDDYLPGGKSLAGLVGVLIICSELFALPFLMRMKLSPLAHITSGALVVFAPLWWALLTFLALGLDHSTGQLGEFVKVMPNVSTLVVNTIWLAVSFYALYTLGYNRLKVQDLTKSTDKKIH